MVVKMLGLLFLVHANIYFCLSNDLPGVETPLGKILGVWKTSAGGRKYAAFEGIPFAKPPVGDLRFEEPQPVEPWSEVLNANEPHTCLQVNLFNMAEILGEEDCLYLNVYVPAEEIDPQRNFDVMVHIHGGAFMVGSGHGMVDSNILTDRDFITVTINYRLGPLGFLSTEDAAIPGNNGLKDQVLALKWVQDNIASFGGNPNSVTITGFSAGAASVHYHYFSPMSKGLFTRGLSQSGTALDTWAFRKNPLQVAKSFAALVGCPDNSTSQMKQCLKEKSGALFLEKMNQLSVDGGPVSVAFVPVVERGSPNPFLVKDPYLMLEEKEVLDVPWITSSAIDEGLVYTGAYYAQLETVDSTWLQMAGYLLDYTLSVPEAKREDVAKKIKDFYLGPGEHINKDNFHKFTKIFTDRMFAIGAEVAAKLQSRANKSPVYYYLFNYEKGENKMAVLYTRGEYVKGVVAHGDDTLYFYSSPMSPITSESDVALRNACHDMLYSYVTTGKPSFDGTDSWEPTTDTELVYLNIAGPDNIKLQRTNNLTPIEFWRSLGLLENEHQILKDDSCKLLTKSREVCLSNGLPEVTTPLGKILGAWRTSIGGRKYAAFEGVPYAKPPIRELRFEEPEPIQPWSEALNATRTHTCLQISIFNMKQTQGDEDCLYLNVYVPSEEIDPQRNFDVLVHIHGGGFLWGSGHMMVDSRILMDRDLVVVSVNYRLGILGFLSTEDAAIPGNNGMKDQVLALRWIKDNIASFGGNPDSVTITGLSAGAASVHLHYFSPMSKGLFVRGLSQSGTATDAWAIKENPLETAEKLAVLVDCPSASTSELKQCLKEKPAGLIMRQMDHFSIDGTVASITFAPVIEKGAANPFLSKNPYLMLEEKEVLDVPWITSTTTDEGLLATGSYYAKLEKINSDWFKIARYLLDFNCTTPAAKREEIARRIKDFYLGPDEQITKDNFNKFTQIFTDRLFATGAEMAAKLQSRANKSPVYYYLFNYKEGEHKMVKLYARGENLEGVAHADDGLYFYTSLFFQLKTKSDVDLRNACQDMLYSYATTGKPSFDGTDNWLPTKDSELVYLNITGPKDMKLQRTEHLAPVEFWRSLGLLENEHLVLKDEL